MYLKIQYYTLYNNQINARTLIGQSAVGYTLYNNQINARTLIGQSAAGYCASKPMEKISRPLNYYIKAIDHKFLWFMS